MHPVTIPVPPPRGLRPRPVPPPAAPPVRGTSRPGRLAALARAGGQGTVEYVALILLVAGVLAAVVAWGSKSYQGKGLGERVTKQLEESIGKVGAAK